MTKHCTDCYTPYYDVTAAGMDEVYGGWRQGTNTSFVLSSVGIRRDALAYQIHGRPVTTLSPPRPLLTRCAQEPWREGEEGARIRLRLALD